MAAAKENNQENPVDKESKIGKWLPWVISGTAILSLAGAYIFSSSFQEFLSNGYNVISSGDEERITSWVDQFGLWGPFLIVAGMIVQMFMIVVNVVLLMLVSILAYGPFLGSIIAIAGIFTASTFGYFIGRLFGPGTISKILGKKTQDNVQDSVKKYGYWAIALARFSPWLSNDAISFVAGLLAMNYWKFMGATLLGILPLTILIAWLGEDWERLKSGLIWISAISVVAFIGYIIYKKVRKRR